MRILYHDKFFIQRHDDTEEYNRLGTEQGIIDQRYNKSYLKRIETPSNKKNS